MNDHLILYTPVIFSLIILIFIWIGYYWLKIHIEKSSTKFLTREDVNYFLDIIENNLISHIRRLKPTTIIAVNRGGIEIVDQIAKKSELDLQNCCFMYCSVPVPSVEQSDADCDIHVLTSSPVKFEDISYQKIMFIDDVYRTGISMERALDCFYSKFKGNLSDSTVFVTALIATRSATKKIREALSKRDIPSENFYAVTETPHIDVRLPWHHSINDPYIARARVNDFATIAKVEQRRKNELLAPLDQLNMTLKLQQKQSGRNDSKEEAKEMQSAR